jgi:hypothetical protein
MRSFKAIGKLIVSAVLLTSLLTGCVVVERPHHYHDGYDERYHGRPC